MSMNMVHGTPKESESYSDYGKAKRKIIYLGVSDDKKQMHYSNYESQFFCENILRRERLPHGERIYMSMNMLHGTPR
jgi:hypothetical protein